MVAASLLPLALYILLSGVDDLLIDAFWIRRLLFRPKAPLPPYQPDLPLAVFVPLWEEADVIGAMLDHNLAAIDYTDYEVFIGVYPNDAATCCAVRALERCYARVHMVEVPHDGPTSKADCLNWIYQGMLHFEEKRGLRFELVVIHDAEDLIHPRSFREIRRHSALSEMVQVPVLALPTGWREPTHGVYCDDFAESQGKDRLTRVELGGFLPGCGVGTGFRRDALERLAEAQHGWIFDPASLTEDYDIGLRLFQLGCGQSFVPLRIEAGAPVATREYFPRTLGQAVRQRSRWVTGNALQSWERYGWGKGLRLRPVQAWFFWRDRKGLWGNPLSLLCNVLLVYGFASWLWSVLTEVPWALWARIDQIPAMAALMYGNAALLAGRVAVRCAVVGRIYGPVYAMGVPPRMVWANWINSRATFSALAGWLQCRVKREPLQWLKTRHVYPTRGILSSHKRLLGEVLVAQGYCTRSEVDQALAAKPVGVRLGEHLVGLGWLSEEALYSALSLQQGVPHISLEPGNVVRRVARALPENITAEWSVLPFRIHSGGLDVASPMVPSDEMQSAIQRFTRLEVRFHLVTPSGFEKARRQWM